MSMPLGFSTKVSLFSMRRRWIRTTLSLIPCVLLIAVLFVGSTIPNGLVTELDNKLLKEAESRQEIVRLDAYMFNQPQFSSSGSMSGTQFNQEVYDLATKAEYVKEVYPQYGTVSGMVPELGNVKNSTITMLGTSPEFAELYTSKQFVYIPGEPIPILLSPGGVNGQKYEWDGKTTLEVDYSDGKDVAKKIVNQQLKHGEKLVGKTFTVSFSTFPQYPEAFEQYANGGFGSPKSTLTQLTAKDKEILDKRVNEIYAPYWNLAALKQPISYEFKVVGINTDLGTYDQYIPNEASVAIWNAIYARQANARTAKVLDKEFLSKESVKTEVSENFLSADPYTGLGFVMQSWQKDKNTSAWQVPLDGVGVPGLLVESTKNARGENVYKELRLPAITKDNFRPTAATVRLHSPDDREKYVEYLKDNDIQFFDNSPLGAIRSVRKWSNTIVTWLTIILGAIVALILVTTVSRFVADSRREIGVWRAIGATRLDITQLVLVRTGILILLGIGVGIVIGLAISAYLATSIAAQFTEATSNFDAYNGQQGFIGMMVITLLGGNVPELEAANLLKPDWGLLVSRLGLLALITLLIALLPAWRASRISPVTAIRDGE